MQSSPIPHKERGKRLAINNEEEEDHERHWLYNHCKKGKKKFKGGTQHKLSKKLVLRSSKY